MDNEVSAYRDIKKCILCGSTSLNAVFSAKAICLTGVFPLATEEDPLETPLTLNMCSRCANLQMGEEVQRELMFSEYWYRTGTTNSMKLHMQNHVDFLDEGNSLNAKDVLDIGCNDGLFLSMARKRGANVYGVEPSNAYFDSVIEKDRVLHDFFPCNTWTLAADQFDVIVAFSMFYDVANPIEFLNECSKKLRNEGLLIIEVNYAKTFLERANIDMLGHEHLVYYFIKTFEMLVRETDLYLNLATKNDMNGGNITFYCSKIDDADISLETLKEEEMVFLDNFKAEGFQESIDREFNRLREKVHHLNSDKKTLKLYGASTRGAFICQYLEFGNDQFATAVDIQPNKEGRRIPGTDIIIELEEHAEEPDVYLILPYQFLNEFLENNIDYMRRGGRFMTFRPSFSEYYYESDQLVVQEY